MQPPKPVAIATKRAQFNPAAAVEPNFSAAARGLPSWCTCLHVCMRNMTQCVERPAARPLIHTARMRASALFPDVFRSWSTAAPKFSAHAAATSPAEIESEHVPVRYLMGQKSSARKTNSLPQHFPLVQHCRLIFSGACGGPSSQNFRPLRGAGPPVPHTTNPQSVLVHVHTRGAAAPKATRACSSTSRVLVQFDHREKNLTAARGRTQEPPGLV